jgi:hypothetical protein
MVVGWEMRMNSRRVKLRIVAIFIATCLAGICLLFLTHGKKVGITIGYLQGTWLGEAGDTLSFESNHLLVTNDLGEVHLNFLVVNNEIVILDEKNSPFLSWRVQPLNTNQIRLAKSDRPGKIYTRRQ